MMKSSTFGAAIDESKLNAPPTAEELRALNETYRALGKRVPGAERKLPLVIEFLGPPKAYKTTVRDIISRFISSSGLRTYAPPEGASLEEMRSLREDLVAFNSFTGMYALQNLIRANHPANRYHIALFDRGIVDVQCWFRALQNMKYVEPVAAEVIRKFFALSEWTRRIDGLALFSCSPDIATRRADASRLAIEERLSTSTPFLQSLQKIYESEVWLSEVGLRPKHVLHVNTSVDDINIPRLGYEVARRVAGLFEAAVDPEYATVPANAVGFSGFVPSGSPHEQEWEAKLAYERKSGIESDTSKKQIVAYAYIEVGDKIFRAQRTGASNRADLQGLLTIGFGGHIERIDQNNGDSILELAMRALCRELEEELIFDGEPAIELVGWVNDESNEAGIHHVAAVHRVSLPQGRVAVRSGVLDQEFGEKSWAQVPRERIFADAEKYDPWSRHIVASCLGGPAFEPTAQRRIRF